MKVVKLPSFLLALLLHLCFSAARANSLQVHPKEKVHQLLNEQPIHGVNLNVNSSSSRNGGGGELSLWRREMGEERNLKKSSGGGGGSGGSGGKGGGGKGVGSGGKGGEGGGSQTTRQPRNEKSGGSLTRSHSFSCSTPLFLVSFLLLLRSD
ncbi:glycine-rich cell wall structural protein-like [Zingiber officinale]|uniref:glycine-rich cell wall structural protein-like n=1 Tax=Zingiber officinale TaxID=94328 RepID=UPI001C4D1158|nr:glycine-rich cell wall structural protein-like [Zingiber officinale]